MAHIEIRRENDARRAEVPSPKGPVSETQKVPCPVDKNGRTHVENSMSLTLERKCFMNFESSIDFVYCVIIFVPYALSNFNNH